jgi:hypothetical protein
MCIFKCLPDKYWRNTYFLSSFCSGILCGHHGRWNTSQNKDHWILEVVYPCWSSDTGKDTDGNKAFVSLAFPPFGHHHSQETSVHLYVPPSTDVRKSFAGWMNANFISQLSRCWNYEGIFLLGASNVWKNQASWLPTTSILLRDDKPTWLVASWCVAQRLPWSQAQDSSADIIGGRHRDRYSTMGRALTRVDNLGSEPPGLLPSLGLTILVSKSKG